MMSWWSKMILPREVPFPSMPVSTASTAACAMAGTFIATVVSEGFE